MPELSNSKVYRGGVTAPHLTLETRSCSFHSNNRNRALDFRFNIASKGGGTTSVLFRIGMDDLEAVLTSIAINMPANVGVLSDAASAANRRNLELLKDAQEGQRSGKSLAEGVIEKLEAVEEFVSEKYKVPAGEDEREAEVMNKLEEAISALGAIS